MGDCKVQVETEDPHAALGAGPHVPRDSPPRASGQAEDGRPEGIEGGHSVNGTCNSGGETLCPYPSRSPIVQVLCSKSLLGEIDGAVMRLVRSGVWLQVSSTRYL